MSINGLVRFGPSLASHVLRPRVYRVGMIDTMAFKLKTPEIVGMAGGSAVLALGLAIRGKTGKALMLVGGFSAIATFLLTTLRRAKENLDAKKQMTPFQNVPQNAQPTFTPIPPKTELDPLWMDTGGNA